MNNNLHRELVNIIDRHKKFYSGKRDCLIKFYIPVEEPQEELVYEPPYDGLDWDNQFEEYYKSRVHNEVNRARRRLDMGVGDDFIPSYQPVFGAGIHYAVFGSDLIFMGGTSYIEPLIAKACEYSKLKYSVNNKWINKLAEGMSYCANNGQGVLLASLRGGNGPMDMANGILGNEIFYELIDDPVNMEKVMEICADSCDAVYQIQKQHASNVMGGYISGHGNLWMPEPMFGHISVDASLLTGPGLYERFEKNLIESLAGKHGGFMVHTHMMGWRTIDAIARTKGADILFPANDPNTDTIVKRLEDVLNAIGDRILVIQIDGDELPMALKTLNGRGNVVFLLTATNKSDALRKFEMISKYYKV